MSERLALDDALRALQVLISELRPAEYNAEKQQTEDLG
jgi:hypothetical protein